MRYAFLISDNGNYGYKDGVKKSYSTKHDYAKDINVDMKRIPTAILYSSGEIQADMYLNRKHVKVLFNNFDEWFTFDDSSVVYKGIYDEKEEFWGCVRVHGRTVLMKFPKGPIQYLTTIKRPLDSKIVIGRIISEGGDK